MNIHPQRHCYLHGILACNCVPMTSLLPSETPSFSQTPEEPQDGWKLRAIALQDKVKELEAKVLCLERLEAENALRSAKRILELTFRLEELAKKEINKCNSDMATFKS